MDSVGETKILNKVEDGNDQTLIDIDSKHKDLRMCSLYAAEFTCGRGRIIFKNYINNGLV
ncbi:hypothetical protein Hanom_Chr05g00450301 [Helianthus anomalus]